MAKSPLTTAEPREISLVFFKVESLSSLGKLLMQMRWPTRGQSREILRRPRAAALETRSG